MKRHVILLVDDESSVLSAFTRALRLESYTVLTAASSAEALRILSAREVSIVVSDYNMPDMNGLEFLKQVKTDYPHLLTIMLTGKADIEIAINAINEAGIHKFIQKPWEDAYVKGVLQRTLKELDYANQKERLRHDVQTRETILNGLEKKFPGITRVEKDSEGYVVIDI